MGVSIDVESIITSSREHRGPVEVQKRWGRAYIHTICRIFGWSELPWEDPSEVQGFDTSMGNGGYSLFLSLAWAIEMLDDEPTSHIPDLIHAVETIHRSPSEYQYPELRNNCKLFPHLLDRNIERSYYLPVDFAKPVHAVAELSERGNVRASEISIGSSIQLARELEFIAPLLENIVVVRGENTHVPTYNNYSWGYVNDVCLTLLIAAKNSVEINLPLSISW